MSSLGSLDLLKKYQIPVPNSVIAQSFNDAKVLFENQKIKFPVLLKGESKNVIHKTDLGLVIANIYNNEQLAFAFESLNANASKNGIQLEKIRIEEMVIGGTEIFIGGKRDFSLGDILVIGTGGIFAEIYKDSYSNLMSDDPDVILGYLKKTKIFGVLNGSRNLPKKDVAFLIKAIISLEKMFKENENISEFDLNPLIVLEKGGFAVDFNFIQKNCDVKIFSKRNRKKIPQDVFSCDSIAIVGASENRKKIGFSIFNNALKQEEYKVIPINNRRESILGVKTFPSVTAIPEYFNIGICLICVPAKDVLNVLQECCDRNIKFVIIISAGFGEYSESGKILEQKILEIIKGTETRVVGPNCMGMMAPKYGLNLNFATEKVKSGNIGLISQSGAIFSFCINSINKNFQNYNIGFSFAFSIGNQCDLDLTDYLDFLLDDESTKVVLLYVEGIKNAKEFLTFCQNKKIEKPIILIQAGVSQKSTNMALTHTGALFSNYEVFRNVCDNLRFITTSSISDAINVASFLSQQDNYFFKDPIVLSNSGGINIMINDYLEKSDEVLPCLSEKVKEKLRIKFPQINCNVNPIDVLGDISIDRIKGIFEVLREDDSCDTIVFVGVMYSLFQISVEDIVELKKNCPKKFIICLLNWNGEQNDFEKLAQENIFIFTSLEFFLPVLLVLLKMRDGNEKK